MSIDNPGEQYIFDGPDDQAGVPDLTERGFQVSSDSAEAVADAVAQPELTGRPEPAGYDAPEVPRAIEASIVRTALTAGSPGSANDEAGATNRSDSDDNRHDSTFWPGQQRDPQSSIYMRPQLGMSEHPSRATVETDPGREVADEERDSEGEVSTPRESSDIRARELFERAVIAHRRGEGSDPMLRYSTLGDSDRRNLASYGDHIIHAPLSGAPVPADGADSAVTNRPGKDEADTRDVETPDDMRRNQVSEEEADDERPTPPSVDKDWQTIDEPHPFSRGPDIDFAALLREGSPTIIDLSNVDEESRAEIQKLYQQAVAAQGMTHEDLVADHREAEESAADEELNERDPRELEAPEAPEAPGYVGPSIQEAQGGDPEAKWKEAQVRWMTDLPRYAAMNARLAPTLVHTADGGYRMQNVAGAPACSAEVIASKALYEIRSATAHLKFVTHMVNGFGLDLESMRAVAEAGRQAYLSPEEAIQLAAIGTHLLEAKAWEMTRAEMQAINLLAQDVMENHSDHPAMDEVVLQERGRYSDSGGVTVRELLDRSLSLTDPLYDGYRGPE